MKKINIILLIIFILFLFFNCDYYPKSIKEEEFNWNNGYCELDNGRLRYDSVGSKYHYKCEICGKDYTFNRAMSYYKD